MVKNKNTILNKTYKKYKKKGKKVMRYFSNIKKKTKKKMKKIGVKTRKLKKKIKKKIFGGKDRTNLFTTTSHKNKYGANCSPRKGKLSENQTCYSKEAISDLKELWNARHSDLKIKSNDSNIIYDKLKKYMSNVCSTEMCWLNQHQHLGPSLTGNIKQSFRPIAPENWKKNPYDWLSSDEISNVMYQYELAYSNFIFIGPSPINFDDKKHNGVCVWDELCHFNLNDLIKKGIDKIGFIFNTDPDHKSGQHWISLFIDIKKKTITFFDSAGSPIPKQIKVFINRVKTQGLPELEFDVISSEGIINQRKDSECGVYSLFFICNMCDETIDSKNLQINIFKDEFIHKFRKIFFN